MSQEWYVYQQEQQRGPYTWEGIWELARSGGLKPEDRVWTEGMADWSAAGQIPGLSGIPASATVPPPPPAVGSEARPTLLPPAAGVAVHGARVRPSTSKLIPAVAGVIVLVAGGLGAAYVLFLRDRGLPASPVPSAALSQAATSTVTPSNLGEGDDQTHQAAADTEKPADPTMTPTLTAPADGVDDDQPTTEPTIEPTREPTLQPTPEPTVDTEAGQSSPESPAEPGETSNGDQPGLPSPAAVVDEFVRVTLGTVPSAAVDYDRARVLMTAAYAAEFNSPEFVPLTYGIQQGPTSYEIAAEDLSGSTATVLVLGYWGADLGRQWRFVLEEEAGLWRVTSIEVLDAGKPADHEDAQSSFWQLNPELEAFTVNEQGGWKLVVAFDPPAEDIGADVRIEYRREDDGSLAYSQESSGVISAGRIRLTLDSDWTGYDLSQLGFTPGRHRVAATIDGVEIASGELIVQ